MKYRLEIDDKARRFWMCVHDDGTLEPLPPGFQLLLRADQWDQGGRQVGLPIGTELELKEPEDPAAVEQVALKRILASALRRELAQQGKEVSEEEASRIVEKTIDDLRERRPVPPEAVVAREVVETPRRPLIVPGSRAMVDQLVANGLGVKSE